MERDIEILEKLEFISYGKKEDIEALGIDENTDTTAIIKKLINKYKEQEETIEKLQFHRQADYMVHEHDVRMIDQVKGDWVELNRKKQEQEKIIELMAQDIADMTGSCPYDMCNYERENCKEICTEICNNKEEYKCFIEYYEKKARGNE